MSEEVLTCRFCHDEGTETKPLFYPCKCTGSIKYIHKECLDEWLKHSKQKKCGVCKEMYAYKTVYAGNMPRYMPVIDTVKLFYRQVSPSIKKTANTIFVCIMWLIVLPYTLHLNLSLLAFVCRYMLGVNANSDNFGVGKNGLLGLVVNVVIQALNSYLPTLLGLVAVPCATRIYAIVDKRYEETINREAARIREKQEQDEAMFNQAVRELMPLGNLADNNENRLQRINEMRQQLDEAIARLHEMRERIEMDFRHFGLIPARWLHNVGLFGIGKKVAKLYLTQLMKAHLAVLLLYWIPFTTGLAIAYTDLSMLAYIFDICVTIFNSIIWHEYKYLINTVLGLMGLAMVGYFKSSLDAPTLMQLLLILPFCVKNAEVYELWVLMLNGIADFTWIFEFCSNKFLYTRALSALEENNAYSSQILLLVGYIGLLVMFWWISSITKRYVKPEYAKTIWVCRGFVNYILVGVLLLVCTIAVLGLMFSLPFIMMIKPDSLAVLFSCLKSNFWTTVFVLWIFGQVQSIAFFSWARAMKNHTRPGLLWYIAGANTIGVNEVIFQYNVGKYICTMAKSALYILASTTLITSVPLLILQRLSLISLSDITISGSTFELAVGCVFGLLLWNSKFISVWSTSIFSYVSSKASQYLGITEYVTGKQNILDEGQWSFKGMKWLYIPFAKYFMPNYIVENAFKQAHVRLSDRAKVGKKRKSLPTKKYYARIQQAIDRSLTDTCLAFTLKPNNVRVPGTNSTNVHKMRKYAIPLNDDGMPVDPMYDYEAADHPERRKWAKSQGMVIPPSVVDEYDGKYIFKKNDYSTVYLPPALELRETLYFGSVFVVFSTMAFVALSCIWNIGYFALKWSRIENTSILIALFAGYLIALLGRSFVASALKLLHGNNSMASPALGGLAVQSIFKEVFKVCCITLAFGVVLPALLGMVREMYISVPYYHYYSSGYPQYTSDTSLLQVASRMWKNNVIPAIAGSFALFFTTDNEWLDDVYVSIFDGNSLRQVWRLVKRRAIPAAAKLVAIYLLPILLAAVNLMLNHSLTSDTFRRLVLLKDADVLAPLVRISMLSYAVVLFATKVIVTYRNCVQVVRDKLYAVNQILENVDGSSTPHFGPSEPATPTAA